MSTTYPTLFRTEALTKLAEDIATLSSRVDSLDSGTDSSTSSSDIKTYTVSSTDRIPNMGLTYYLFNSCTSFRMTVAGSRCLIIDITCPKEGNITHYNSPMYIFSSSIGYDWVSTSEKHIIDKVYQHKDETDEKLICYTLCIDSTGVYIEIENVKDTSSSSSELSWKFAEDTYFNGIVNLEDDETFTNGIEHKGEVPSDTSDEDQTDTSYYSGTVRSGSNGFYTIDLTAIDGFDYSKYDNLVGYHYIVPSGDLYEHSAGSTYLYITNGTLYVYNNYKNYTGTDYENKYHFLVYATSSTSNESCFIMGRFIDGDTCYACSGSAFHNMCPLSVAYGFDPKYIPYTLDTWNATADETKNYPSLTVHRVNDNGDMAFDLSGTDYSDYTTEIYYYATEYGSVRSTGGTTYITQTGSVIKITTIYPEVITIYPNNYHVLVNITKDESSAWVVFRSVDNDTGYIITNDELENDYPLCVKDGYNPLDIGYPINAA